MKGRFGATVPNSRSWSSAGAVILEIDTGLLTVRVLE
jgi:hypothetical protein